MGCDNLPANHAQTAGIGDGRSQLGASGNVHTSQENWVGDLEQISADGADLLCMNMLADPLRCSYKKKALKLTP